MPWLISSIYIYPLEISSYFWTLAVYSNVKREKRLKNNWFPVLHNLVSFFSEALGSTTILKVVLRTFRGFSVASRQDAPSLR